ncbi:TerC family protein [Actinocorallia sp. A-T 12471]|uniref:TerC family protein n=1 Tax=Actinocorallia sp. A-T 12471 TaxID=3089813 RepID=UPI0029D12884|nr:TerC family protein [Actinocorallia sp. A-T 12471]MDX6739703.1 TerC family protein [Actinocorallia sp. A-T 12471]
MEVTTFGWAMTLAVIAALFALDLTVGVLRPHAVGFREATVWSVFYIAVALLFGLFLGMQYGWGYGGEYFTGYIVEKSLSIDNLFVFVIIMTTFAVPKKYQQKVLTIGILLALIMRAVFIAVGATLLSMFSFMFLIFGLLLLWTALQVYRHRDEDPDIADNLLVRTSRRLFTVTDDYVGGKFTSKVSGKRALTPLFLVLLAIGGTDLLFALDSIPAIFGITEQAYIVFAANAFALLGLRALYFLVTGLLDRLVYLATGLAIILAFIGVKLVLHWAHGLWDWVPEISTALSLVVIVVVLTITTVASLRRVKRDPTAKAHSATVMGHKKDQPDDPANGTQETDRPEGDHPET